jgi:hypothetical protein
MTAIVRTLTPQGFAIAADGRKSNSESGLVESDSVQKIFAATSTVGVFALSFSGAAGLISEGGEELILPRAVAECSKLLASRKTSNAVGYAHRLGRCIIDEIKRLGGPIHSGASAQPNLPDETGDTIFRLGLDGYEGNKPIAIDSRFYHVYGQIKDPEIKPQQPLLFGFHRVFAPSPQIGYILWSHGDDQRLSAYRGPTLYAEEITLQDAIDRSRSFIGAHSDPEAIAIDGNCRSVGGHIHIATITPSSGFQWLIPPTTEA